KWSQKLEEAQKLTNEATRLEFAKDYSSAFAKYVRAGELYLSLARTYDDRPKTAVSVAGESGTDLKTRIKKAAEKVLNRAEKIKSLRKDIKPVQKKVLSVEEQSRILDLASKIGTIDAPVWKQEGPSTSTIEQPALAPLHLKKNATYRSRKDGLFWSKKSLYSLELQGSEIVQDIVNDCSFIAALEVAAQYDAKWGTNLATGPLFPKGTDQTPKWDDAGRHQVRFHMNGTKRKIEIDDAIPCDDQGTPMCALGIPSSDPKNLQLWPALLEKAYLLIRGGYDFKGSNAAMDLHVLTGWIPEQLGLHRDDFHREKVWERLVKAMKEGNAMLTAGTSKNTQEEYGQIRLIRSHNYAVLDLIEDHAERKVVLMNPWRQPVSSGASGGGLATMQTLNEALPVCYAKEQFTITWDELCARFDSLYISWNPKMFKMSSEFHGIWRSSRKNGHVQVQLNVEPSTANPVPTTWVHLVKHFPPDDKERAASSTVSEWISAHAFDNENEGVLHHSEYAGEYVDGLHALTRFKTDKKKYTLVASRQIEENSADGAIDRCQDSTFTMTVYSNASHISLEEVENKYPFEIAIPGQWTLGTAGGNPLEPTFMHNPQYAITVPASGAMQTTSVRISAEASKDVSILILLLWPKIDQGSVQRTDHFAPGDIVCSSETYNYGLAIAQSTKLKPGIPYTLIISTYSPGHLGPFNITVQTQTGQAEVKPIPMEGAGMYQQRLRDRWSIAKGTAAGAPRFGRWQSNPSWTFSIDRKMQLTARLTIDSKARTESTASESSINKRPHLNVTVIGQESGKEIASSGPYANIPCGVAIRNVMLEPGNYTIIASTFDMYVEAAFTLQLFT
ncbi:cysteine proteinase, partial [Meira miltonrushii]